jgi:hypothetical protein
MYYYGILSSLIIQNVIAPGLRHATGLRDTLSCSKREEAMQEYHTRMQDFYQKLVISVLRDGFDNPILVKTGKCIEIYKKYLPESMKVDENKILVCDSNGGSRLWVAQNFRMDIPCVISDFSGMFKDSNFKKLSTEDDVKKCYKSAIENIVFGDQGITFTYNISPPIDK